MGGKLFSCFFILFGRECNKFILNWHEEGRQICLVWREGDKASLVWRECGGKLVWFGG